MINQGSFAEACYDQNTINELETALTQDADQFDCAEYGLNPQQWRDQIFLALAAKKEDLK